LAVRPGMGLLLLGEGRFGFVHHGMTFGFVFPRNGRANFSVPNGSKEAEFKLHKVRALIHPSPAGMRAARYE
jgi:hypothetical protein